LGRTGLAESVSAVVDVRRLVNDANRKIAVENGQAAFHFLCECGDLGCQQRILLAIAAYDSMDAGSVRAHYL